MKENFSPQESEKGLAEFDMKKLQRLYDGNPLLNLLDISFERREDGVKLELDVARKHTNIYGIAHGAVLFAMADTAMGCACYAKGLRVVTLDSSMNFIKAAPEGVHLYALGKVIHAGRHTAVCEAGVYDEADELCLKTQGTFFVLNSEEVKP